MNQRLVTIVIPCYNYGILVDRAIESVFSQDYKNIELIVINDGSTDNSDRVITDLKLKYGFQYVKQKNMGIVRTRNKAVKLAGGEYIIQLDADDYIPDNYVSTLVSAANDSSADIFYTKAINPKTAKLILNPKKFNRELLKHQNYIHASSMYRKSLFEKNKYDEWLNGYALEDWDFNLGVVLKGSEAQLVEDTFLYYEQHDEGRSNQSRGNSIVEQEAVFYIVSKYYNQYPEEMKSPMWLARNIKKLIDREHILSKENSKYTKKIEVLNAIIISIQNSKSYRIGRIATSPARVLKKPLKNVKHRYLNTVKKQRINNIIKKYYDLNLSGSLKAMPEIGVVVQERNQPSSSTYIRIISLLSYTSYAKQFSVNLVDGDNPLINKNMKAVIVQRVAIKDKATAIALVTSLKKENIKLYVDTDDAFAIIDKSHPEYKKLSPRVDALNYVINNADEVWFSTKELQELYEVKKSVVIHNTIDAHIWERLRDKEVKVPKIQAPLKMLYMGTKTHGADFAMVLPALEELSKKYPGEFELHVVGIASDIKNYSWLVKHVQPSALYPEFVAWFNKMQPFDIGICPLEDTAFNKKKSDIKCLDYLAVGVKPLVSDVEAYSNSELDDHIVRVLNDRSNWFTAFEKELKNREKYRKIAPKRIKSGYNYLLAKRSPMSASKVIEKKLMIKKTGNDL